MTSEMKGPLSDRIDRLCDQLESDLKSGKPTRIEELIRDSSGDERVELLRHLLAVEIDFRRARHDDFTVAEFVERFPEESALIHEVFDSPLPAEESVKTVSGGTDPAIQETIDVSMASTDETVVPLPSATDSFPGALGRFGDYELLQEIARGGMGVVYKARQVSLNRIIALKMIKSGELAGDEEIRRFRAEAEAAAKLDHPNIVPIHEVGEENGQQFFSMGFVEGKGLDARLKEGPLPPREAAELIRTIAEAIQYAHDKGIVHRDLKPANVLIDLDGKPRITDFGLAKNIAADSGVTATGQVLGTPNYMPPEQAAGQTEQIGPLADVYSLGAMLYALLTGRPPFQAANVMETLKQVCEQEPVSPRVLNVDVDRDLETVCLKCLEKNARQRYASAQEFADELARYLDGKPILARPVGRLERTKRWCKRNPLGATVVGLLVFLAIAGPAVAIRLDAALSGETKQRKKAEQERKRAEINERIANAKEMEVRESNIAIQRALQKERIENYASQIRAIQLEIRSGSLDVAEKMLLNCDQDLRGWEHNYLHSLCRPFAKVLPRKNSSSPIICISTTKNGSSIAISHSDGSIELLNTVNWRRLIAIDSYTVPKGTPVSTVSPTGERIARAGPNGGIQIWETSTGIKTDVISEKVKSVGSLAFNPDGSRLVISERAEALPSSARPNDDTGGDLVILDAATGRTVKSLSGHSASIQCIAYSDDGKLICSSSADGQVKLWNAQNGSLRHTLAANDDPNGVTLAAFSPNGDMVASRGTDGTLRIWSAFDGRLLKLIKCKTMFVTTPSFSSDGTLVAIGGSSTQIFDTASGKQLHQLARLSHSVHFRHDDQLICATNDEIRFWDFRRLNEAPLVVGYIRPPTSISAGATISHDGKFAAVGVDNDIVLCNLVTKQLAELRGHKQHVNTVAFSAPHSHLLYSGSADGTVRVWNTKSLETINTINLGSAVASLDVSASQKLTIGLFRNFDGPKTSTLRLLHPTDGSVKHLSNDKSVQVLTLSSNGRMLATGGLHREITIWDVASGHKFASFSISKVVPDEPMKVDQVPLALEFNREGSRLAIVVANAVIVINAETGQELIRITSQKKFVCGTWSPDGERFATAEEDGEGGLTAVRLWELNTGQCVAKLNRGIAAKCLRFTNDAKQLLATDGVKVQAWKIGRAQAVSSARQ